jgi:hypothetical protein
MTDETILDNYLGYLSGHPRISGRAFLSRQGFYVSIDTIRPGKHVLQAFLRSPPASKKQAEGASSYSHRFDAALRKRFLARFGIDYPNQKPDGTLLDRTFQAFLHGHLHNVWLHELGHLVDFERYVPLSENLSTNIWVALRCGLSPARIELRFEQMAETFSLATTRFPYLSIQDNLNRLSLNPDSLFYMILVAWQKKDPKDSPYYTGAKRIIAGLMKQAGLTDPVELAGLSGARIRKLARSVCREEGFPFR